MNLLKLSWKNLWYRPTSTLFTLMILVLGISMMLFIYQVSYHIKAQFEKNISGIDMVIGAKGSPLQLILSAVFQIDTPTGNISMDDALKVTHNRWVKKAIPLSYGDSYRGYRILGTDTSYIRHFNGQLAKGSFWSNEMEVIVGNKVAKTLNLEIGDNFYSAHGLEEEGMSHEEEAYTVVGILKLNNSVIDQLILTPTESIWHVHGDHDENNNEITAMLVAFSSPMGLIRMPRSINQNTNMQAALPSFEINKLFSMLGIGLEVLQYLGYLLIVVAAISLWINISLSLQDRSYELAFLRTHGATRTKLLVGILAESLWICLIGYFAGVLFTVIGIHIFNVSLSSTYGYEINPLSFSSYHLLILLGVLSIGIIASIIPAVKGISSDISSVLSR